MRALILTPTRCELAAQIGENVRDYSKYLNIRSLVVFGGVSINPQMMNCAAAGCWRGDAGTSARPRTSKCREAGSDWRFATGMKPTVCWIWLHSRHLRRVLARNCRRSVRICCSPPRSPTTSKRAAEKLLLRNPLEIEVARRNTAQSR